MMILYNVKSKNPPVERDGYPVLDGVLVKSKAIADRFAANGCPVEIEDTSAPGYMNPPDESAFEGEAEWAERIGYVL